MKCISFNMQISFSLFTVENYSDTNSFLFLLTYFLFLSFLLLILLLLIINTFFSRKISSELLLEQEISIHLHVSRKVFYWLLNILAFSRQYLREKVHVKFNWRNPFWSSANIFLHCFFFSFFWGRQFLAVYEDFMCWIGKKVNNIFSH